MEDQEESGNMKRVLIPKASETRRAINGKTRTVPQS